MMQVAEVEWRVEPAQVRCGDQAIQLPARAGSVRFTKRTGDHLFDGLWVDTQTTADLCNVLEALMSAPLNYGELEQRNRLARLLRQLRDHTAISTFDW